MTHEQKLEETIRAIKETEVPAPTVYRQGWRDACDRCAKAAAEIARLRERLGPVGLEVIEINGAGHYVNEKVKAEIERLRAALAPFARLEIPAKSQGNASFYSIYHKYIEAARDVIARAKGEKK